MEKDNFGVSFVLVYFLDMIWCGCIIWCKWVCIVLKNIRKWNILMFLVVDLV